MPLASEPDGRADALEVYLGHRGEGALALAFAPAPVAGPGGGAGLALRRATSSVLRGGLTGWVHVGMTVRRLRGRADPLQGLGQRDTFAALARLVQAAIEARPLPGAPPAGEPAAHVRLLVTPLDAADAVERIQRVLRPYAAAGTVTHTGPAVISWFAIRHLIAARSRDYSLQVVHVCVDGVPGGQVSLMLPADPAEPPADEHQAPTAPPAPSHDVPQDPARYRPGYRLRRGRRAARDARSAAGAAGTAGLPGGAADVPGLQAYLDAYREHLTRELLLEPVVTTGAVTEFAWTPEAAGDGGVAVAGTVPGAVAGAVVLRMAEHAVAQLGERLPESAGTSLSGPEPEGDLLVQRWSVGTEYVLSVAARSGDRRRPTQVLIHFAAAERRELDGGDGGSPDAGAPALPPPPHEPPRSGPEVDEARGLSLLPLWWHSAEARCDGNDVILYEMPFRGRRLRLRANDYPAEPMYTLLVGEPGAEVAAVDLEYWPSSWVRPRSF
jgi:hypothetical protein